MTRTDHAQAQQPAAPARRKPRLWQVLAGVWATSAVAAGAVLVGTDRHAGPDPAHDSDHTVRHADAGPAVRTTSAPVRLGAGTATLEIDAARGDDGVAVLAGRPVTLRVRLDGVPDTGTPTLDAERTPAGSMTPEPVALGRSGSVAIDSASGELYLLTGSSEHDHEGAGSRPGNGSGLASVAGSAAEWAARLTPGAVPRVSQDGRWIVAAHPGHPLLDVVDTLLRTVRAVTLPAPAVATTFDGAADRLWAVDAGGGLALVDPATATVLSTSRVELGPARPGAAVTLVAAPGAGHLVVGSPGGAGAVVPAGAGASPVVLAGPTPGEMAWSPALDAFVGLAGDGSIVSVSPAGARAVVAAAGGPSPTTAALLAVHPAGRRAAVVRGATAEIVDLTSGRVVGRAATGADPRQVVVVDHFAVVRDGKAASVVWIDLDQPERSAELPLGTDSPPSALRVSADGTEVLIAVPAQRKVLRADIMMGRPMIMASEPTGLAADLVVRSQSRLVPAGPGSWQLTTVLPAEGSYRLVLRTAVGEAAFDLDVAGEHPARVVDDPLEVVTDVDRSVTLRFAFGGAAPQQLELVAYSEAAAVQQRLVADRVALDGDVATYTTAFTPRVAGQHQVFVTPTDGTPIGDALVASVTAAPRA